MLEKSLEIEILENIQIASDLVQNLASVLKYRNFIKGVFYKDFVEVLDSNYSIFKDRMDRLLKEIWDELKKEYRGNERKTSLLWVGSFYYFPEEVSSLETSTTQVIISYSNQE